MSAKRHIIRSIANALGFDIRRLRSTSQPGFQLLQALNRFQIDVVLDVGANVGQFARDLRRVGYRGQLVSFEPLSEAHRQLSKAAHHDPDWHVHSRGAIGNRTGEISINVAGNLVSSSVLPMLDAHAEAAKGSAYVGVENAPMFRLDSVAPTYLASSSNPFLKIDTQGYEWQVLDGARDILTRIRGILCELSLVPLYEGNPLWMDVIRRLEAEGFVLWSIQKGFTDPRDGRTLQLDAVFFRL